MVRLRARAAKPRSSVGDMRKGVTFPPHARLFSSHVLTAAPPVTLVRKSADALVAKEQETFKNAVTKAISDGIYSRLVRIHANMNHDMHTMSGMPGSGTMRFLPWHRVYLVNFEQALRAFEPSFFIPYWRWMDENDIPQWIKSFRPSGVTDVNGKPIPVRRAPGANPKFPSLPTSATIRTTVMSRSDYRSFTLALEGAQPFGAHNLVHMWCNGTMSNVPVAPADPIFWMHHAEIDRIWSIWRGDNPAEVPTLTGANAILDPWPENAKDVLDMEVSGYSYSYDRTGL